MTQPEDFNNDVVDPTVDDNVDSDVNDDAQDDVTEPQPTEVTPEEPTSNSTYDGPAVNSGAVPANPSPGALSDEQAANQANDQS